MPVEHFNVISTDIPNDAGVCCTTRFKNGGGVDMRAVLEEDARRSTLAYRCSALIRRLFRRR
jgi:hypothetical protein